MKKAVLKNLSVDNLGDPKVSKISVHSIVGSLRERLGFQISSLIINFITSEQIEKINSEYLKHHYSTDIITFNYSGDTRILDGEIFISVEDAQENAIKYDVDYRQELKRLVIHGVLHLLGYDDKSEADRNIMKKLEDELVGLIIF